MSALIWWSVIVVLTVAAFVSASLGLVDAVAFIGTVTFLSYLTVVMLWATSYTAVSGQETER